MKGLILKFLVKLQSPTISHLDEGFTSLRARVDEVNKKLDKVSAELGKLQQIKDIAAASYDNIPQSTKEVFELRKRAGYQKAFMGTPLVSVRIATYNRADDLINKAIASVLKQTYTNFEVVVVGDHCTDDTEERVMGLNDKRIRFYNLPNKVVLPGDKIKKWRVVGVHPKNTAADMAKGQWIATLDDDDELTPDHLEKLVAYAKKTKCELVYGAGTQIDVTIGKKKRLWAFPPQRGQFTFNTAIYMKALDTIFKSDAKAWVMEEVHDWTMCRQMMESGVKIAALEDNLSNIYMVPPRSDKKDYLHDGRA